MTRLWFRARSYGWGWTPMTLEGWLVIFAFLVAVGIITGLYIYRMQHGASHGTAMLVFLLAIGILTGLLIAVCWVTGERPRWRWGE
jgi:hypothetical protein